MRDLARAAVEARDRSGLDPEDGLGVTTLGQRNKNETSRRDESQHAPHALQPRGQRREPRRA